MTLLLSLSKYFKDLGKQFNDLGIQLIALNKFLTGYIDSEEPYPPTPDFLESVKKEMDQSELPFYLERDISPLELSKIGLPDPEYVKELMANFKMSSQCAVSRKRTVEIGYHINVAYVAFKIGLFYFWISSEVEYHDKFMQLLNENEKLIKRHNRDVRVEFTVKETFDADRIAKINESREIIEAANFFANIVLAEANQEIGYWKKWIEDIRSTDNRIKKSNTSKQIRISKRKQRVCELFFSTENRSELGPYQLANEIINRWSPKDMAPSPATIIRYLRNENLIA